VTDPYPDSEETVSDVLLRVHRSYLPAFTPLLHDDGLHALAHITGGGIPENLDRVMPPGHCAVVRRSGWTVPQEFVAVQDAGSVPQDDMERTFNMGIGMVAVVAAAAAEPIAGTLRAAGEQVYVIGEVTAGAEPVRMES